MPSKIAIWRSATLSGAAALVAAQSSMYADYAFKGGIDFIDEHFGAFLIAAFASVGLCTLGSLIGGTSVHGPFFLIFLPMLSSNATVPIRAHADLVEEIPNDTEQSLWGAD